MFTKVLVASDGSDHAHNAVRHAGSIAGRYGAELLIAHVLTDQAVPSEIRHMAEVEHLVDQSKPRAPRFGQLSVDDRAASDERRLAAAVGIKILEQAEALAKREGAEKVQLLDLDGNEAGDVLVETARQQAVDLVVIGSRGFGKIGRLVHGSVSAKVCQEVQCPCLIVK